MSSSDQHTRRRDNLEAHQSMQLRLPVVDPNASRQQSDSPSHSKLANHSSALVRQMHKQQVEDSKWVTGLRQRHQEHRLGHEQVMHTLTSSGSSTARMRQLAQAEVDWTSFRSAVELHHTASTDTCNGHAADSMHLPDLTACSSHASIAGCSPRTASAADLSPRSCCSFYYSPRSQHDQVRPYTAPTIVSRQPFHNSAECPFFVSSLYKSNQQAKPGAQSPVLVNSAQSVQSMAEQGSFWSPAPCSSVAPQPFLKANSGGVAVTYGSRERDRPHSGSTQPPADATNNSSKKNHSSSELITAMREGGRLSAEPRASSRIVARSKAWPASYDGHPAGSGLTVRQQACFLENCSPAKHEEKLAEKYGPWLHDMRSVRSCSPANAQTLRVQADAMMTSADDALAPRLYSMGPI